MNREKILDRYFESLELDIVQSEFADAIDLIDRIKYNQPKVEHLSLWLSERTQIEDIFYGAHEDNMPIIAELWYGLLEIIYNDKSKLIVGGQTLINTFGGFGKIVDVNYNEDEQSLMWKVKFLVD